MKKLLSLLILSFFSAQSLGALDVYECEVKINQTIYEDWVYERLYDVDTFIIKFDKNRITFSEDRMKRPDIATYPEFTITGYLNEEKSLLIYGRDLYQGAIHLSHSKEKDDFAYLTISSMGGFDGSIVNLIARCKSF